MRLTFALLLTIAFLPCRAQNEPRWHSAFGFTAGTLNFRQNGVGSLSFPVRYDLVSGHNSSISLGTSLKIGTEDEYGVSFPLIVGLLAVTAFSGTSPDLSNLGNGNSNSQPGSSYSVNLFADFPLMLQYNWGVGTANEAQYRFGWFIGGGMTYTITGVTLNSHGHGTSENFFGWTGNIGIRFNRYRELSLSTTLPLQNQVGPIQHPMFFALTFAFDQHGH